MSSQEEYMEKIRDHIRKTCKNYYTVEEISEVLGVSYSMSYYILKSFARKYDIVYDKGLLIIPHPWDISKFLDRKEVEELVSKILERAK